MFSKDNDLSSNSWTHRQAAINYIRREAAFTAEVGGSYMLIVPGAVGRPNAYDNMEFERSVQTLRSVADVFVEQGIKVAIESIRASEVSLVWSVSDAQAYIAAVAHPGVGHINGDVYHMQSEETHIGEAILAAGNQLVNLHIADSNRDALGDGFMDLDTIIRALYLIGFNSDNLYVTPEPHGSGSDPFPAMYGKSDAERLERLVSRTASYFREREKAVLAGD